MTFAEWCDQIARDTESNVSRQLVREIMITAMRTALEEFLANPADATLDIYGIGKFYLNRKNYDMSKRFHLKDRTECNETVFSWVAHFRPSVRLKQLLNNKCDIKTYRIGTNMPLYSDEDLQADGTIKVKGKRDKTKLVIKPKIVKEKQKEVKERIKSKLPED